MDNLLCGLLSMFGWMFIGVFVVAWFDEDEVMYMRYAHLNHSWQAFLFLLLWPLVLIYYWMGGLDERD